MHTVLPVCHFKAFSQTHMHRLNHTQPATQCFLSLHQTYLCMRVHTQTHTHAHSNTVTQFSSLWCVSALSPVNPHCLVHSQADIFWLKQLQCSKQWVSSVTKDLQGFTLWIRFSILRGDFNIMRFSLCPFDISHKKSETAYQLSSINTLVYIFKSQTRETSMHWCKVTCRFCVEHFKGSWVWLFTATILEPSIYFGKLQPGETWDFKMHKTIFIKWQLKTCGTSIHHLYQANHQWLK